MRAATRIATCTTLLPTLALVAGCFTPDVDAVRAKWRECAVVPAEAEAACAGDGSGDADACDAALEAAILRSIDSADEEACTLAVDCDAADADQQINDCLG